MSDTPRAYGFTCPHCHGGRLVSRNRRRPAPGIRVKYLRCLGCGGRGKSIERLTEFTPPPPPKSDASTDPGTLPDPTPETGL